MYRVMILIWGSLKSLSFVSTTNVLENTLRGETEVRSVVLANHGSSQNQPYDVAKQTALTDRKLLGVKVS